MESWKPHYPDYVLAGIGTIIGIVIIIPLAILVSPFALIGWIAKKTGLWEPKPPEHGDCY